MVIVAFSYNIQTNVREFEIIYSRRCSGCACKLVLNRAYLNKIFSLMVGPYFGNYVCTCTGKYSETVLQVNF